mgnify:CR=1 FL=1
MAISNFVPEVWSATLLSVLQKSLVYAGAPVVNRNYEGEISAFGDTVHIVSVPAPTIGVYQKDTDLTIEVLSDTEQLLVIDQARDFAFEIDDIDYRQARSGGALMAEAAQQAAYGLGDVTDQYVAGKMAVAAGNALGVVDATTATNVYEKLLVPASVKLDQANVPTAGRFMVVDPATYGKLLLDSRFIKANEAGTQTGLRNGVVGEAAGFVILKSNNAPQANRSVPATATSGSTTVTATAPATFNQGDVGLTIAASGIPAATTVVSVAATGATATISAATTAAVTGPVTLSGGGQVAIAGSAIATSYAEQITKVEAFRPEKRFADALKGLHLYGAKVVRPAALVVASVKVA